MAGSSRTRVNLGQGRGRRVTGRLVRLLIFVHEPQHADQRNERDDRRGGEADHPAAPPPHVEIVVGFTVRMARRRRYRSRTGRLAGRRDDLRLGRKSRWRGIRRRLPQRRLPQRPRARWRIGLARQAFRGRLLRRPPPRGAGGRIGRPRQQGFDGVGEPLQVLVDRRRHRVQPMHRADEELERPRRHHVLDPHRQHRPALAHRPFDFPPDLERFVGLGREDQDHDATTLDRVDDRLAPLHPRADVSGRDPAADAVLLQPGAGGVGDDLVLRRIADEDVEIHVAPRIDRSSVRRSRMHVCGVLKTPIFTKFMAAPRPNDGDAGAALCLMPPKPTHWSVEP